ncbi:MAG: PilZ domain-containing protein [Candidatus Omnitrophica bacterium]|nr:PilZ domain-containing protein [Candidatus Omnitrophota bacterium]
MKERRDSTRYNIEIPVSGELVKRNLRIRLTGLVKSFTKDMSASGMKLRWPKGWKCKECDNCRGWVFNDACRLKVGMTPTVKRKLTEGLIIKVKFSTTIMKKKEYHAKVIWTNMIDRNNSAYDVGLSFLDGDKNIERLIEYEKIK